MLNHHNIEIIAVKIRIFLYQTDEQYTTKNRYIIFVVKKF